MTANELKYYSSLLLKKYRTLEKKFIIEGERLINESFSSVHLPENIFFTEEFSQKNNAFVKKIESHKIPSEKIKSAEFQKLSGTKNPQGLAAVYSFLHSSSPGDSINKIALENISDPGNVGTIIRTADWFGFKEIILSNDSAELYNPKTFRATMGAPFHLNVIVPENFYDSLERLKNKKFTIFCADMRGESYYGLKTGEQFVLVLCNEANGPSKKLLNLADKIITIPKFGSIESLNVSAAAAVLLAEIRKNNY